VPPPDTGKPANPPPPPPPPPHAASETRSATAQALRVVLKNGWEAAGAAEFVVMDVSGREGVNKRINS
jgi:hypothetical protein